MSANDERKRPIGVFDSGMGGISVLRELYRIMPYEHFIYMGDSKNAPYGERSTKEVYALTEHWMEYFIEKQAKAVVIACNTATSAAAAGLRRKYPDIPLIGLEPALKPAAIAYAGTGRLVLVMATSLTLRETKFQQLLHQYEDRARIGLVAAPGLVELIEHDDIGGKQMEEYLAELLTPYIKEDVAAVVLGCTHFPFARECIAKVLGRKIEFFDGALGASMELKRQLEKRKLLGDEAGCGSVVLENSMGTPEMLALARRLFELP